MLLKIWFDIQNLRWISFPVRLIRFLPSFRLQGENLTRIWPIFMHFLSGLGHFLANHFEDFDETWSEVRQNGYKSAAKDKRPSNWAILEIFSHKVGKNRPKLAKIYRWSKNFSKNVLSVELGWPGSKKKLKVFKFHF